jgi:hypothetical protein
MELPDMRFKYLKYLAFALGGLSTVVAAGALYLYATFDGVRLAAELTHFAKQRYQRTLRIDGPVELSMFPRLRLQLPAGTLSGRSGGSEFIGFEQASISVACCPCSPGVWWSSGLRSMDCAWPCCATRPASSTPTISSDPGSALPSGQWQSPSTWTWVA